MLILFSLNKFGSKGKDSKIINPQDKQFLGLSQREPLNQVEMLVNEFQIPYTNYFIDTGQPDWTYVSKEIMGKSIDKEWEQFRDSPEFSNSTKLRQREMLIGWLAEKRTEAKVPPVLSLLSCFPDIWLINLFLEVPTIRVIRIKIDNTFSVSNTLIRS